MKTTGYNRIKSAMLEWERRVYSHALKANKACMLYTSCMTYSIPTHNAQERLERKGRLRFVPPLRGHNGGYIACIKGTPLFDGATLQRKGSTNAENL